MDYEKNCSYDPDENVSNFFKNASDDHILEFISDRKINISGTVPIFGYDGTHFHLLCACERYEVINRLLKGEVKMKRKIDVNVISPKRKKTALHDSCLDKKINSFKFLLSIGADINICDSDGNTPIHCLFLRDGNKEEILEMLKLLLRAGSKFDEKNIRGDTPLMLAIQIYGNFHSMEDVDLLLSEGSDIHSICYHERTPFQRAFWVKKYKFIEKYLRSVSEIPQYESVYSVFYNACIRDLDVIVSLFLERGLNVEGIGEIIIGEESCLSPLLCALIGRSSKVIKVLLDYNVKFTYEDDTPEGVQVDYENRSIKIHYGEYQPERYKRITGSQMYKVFQEYFQEKSMKIKPALTKEVREEN